MEKMNKETAVFAVPPFELERINDNKEYFDGIVRHIATQLYDRLIGILDTEKEVIVKRSDLITVEEPGLHQVQFRESINWRPLVRCKDCKFYGFFGRVKICKYWAGDPYEAAAPEEDDFCSFAERRDDGEIH